MAAERKIQEKAQQQTRDAQDAQRARNQSMKDAVNARGKASPSQNAFNAAGKAGRARRGASPLRLLFAAASLAAMMAVPTLGFGAFAASLLLSNSTQDIK